MTNPFGIHSVARSSVTVMISGVNLIFQNVECAGFLLSRPHYNSEQENSVTVCESFYSPVVHLCHSLCMQVAMYYCEI